MEILPFVQLAIIIVFGVLYLRRSPAESNEVIFQRLKVELIRRDDELIRLNGEITQLKLEANGTFKKIMSQERDLSRERKQREELELKVNVLSAQIEKLQKENGSLKRQNKQFAERLGTSPLGDLDD